MTSRESKPLAMAPPPFDINDPTNDEIAPALARIEAAGGPMAAPQAGKASLDNAAAGFKRCSLKKRFDRKDVFAYEWDRNRLAFDVDGIGYNSFDVEEVRMTFSMPLQRSKSKKTTCRYRSSYQGLVGSGYNEFFLREEGTVWEEIDYLQDDAEAYLDKLF